MQIHHVNAGTMCPVGARLINEQRQMVCHCWIIETSSGLVVVDTGLGTGALEDPKQLGRSFGALMGPRLDPDETVAHHVERLGFARSDVRHILVTHLDMDHAGGLADFPDAKVHLHRFEHRAAMRRRGLFAKRRYRSAQWAHRPHWTTYEASSGDRWHGFECVRDLEGLPPEILLIPLFGHTAGHCAIAVETATGWRLHAGDAYFYHGELETPRRCPAALTAFQGIVETERRARLYNQARLRELARTRPEVRITSGHDPFELARDIEAQQGAA